MNRTTTVGVMTAFLLMASGPAMADDQLQARPRGAQQRGGLVQALPVGPGQNQAAPLPIEAPVLDAATTQAPAVSPALPSLPADQLDAPFEDEQALPDLGPAGDAPLGDLEPIQALPSIGQVDPLAPAPIQTLPSIGQDEARAPIAQAEPAKKPGFFKRTWTKVKTFFGNVKERIQTAFARAKERRAERRAARAAEEAAQQAPVAQQVHDIDLK